LKNYSSIAPFALPLVSFAAAACILLIPSTASAAERERKTYALLGGGALCSVDDGGLTPLPIGPGVTRYVVENGAVFYVRAEEGRVLAGRWSPGAASPAELPLDVAGGEPTRLRGSGHTIYALYASEKNGAGTLYAGDINSGEMREAPGVYDFTLYDGRPVLLERGGDGLRCAIGDTKIPLLPGIGAKFGDCADGRLFIISDGEHTEIIDAVAARAVYRYSETAAYRAPTTHNLELEAVDDTIGPPSGRMIFYRVMINGRDAGRTDTGPAETRRVFRQSVAAGEYMVLAPERWELNLKRERYERANNILQPEPMRLFVPEGIVLKVSISFDGRSYRVSASPVVD